MKGPKWGEIKRKSLSGARRSERPWVWRVDVKGPERGEMMRKALSVARRSVRP